MKPERQRSRIEDLIDEIFEFMVCLMLVTISVAAVVYVISGSETAFYWSGRIVAIIMILAYLYNRLQNWQRLRRLKKQTREQLDADRQNIGGSTTNTHYTELPSTTSNITITHHTQGSGNHGSSEES